MTLTKVVGGVIADGTIASVDITDSTITNAKMAVDPSNASNLSSGDVPLAQLGNVPDPDLTAQKGDIALLAFKTQANGNLARYNLVDQSVDAFEDATGISAADSTNEVRDSAGKYYSGAAVASGGTVTSYSTYTVHTFTASGTYSAGSGGSIDVMMIGGGGGAGSGQQSWWGGGGGGAGGMIEGTAYTIATGDHTITIGAGGAGGVATNSPNAGAKGTPGGDTILGSIATAKGGGGGGYTVAGIGSQPAEWTWGLDGGSGGGGAGDENTGYATTPSGASTQASFPGFTSYGFAGGGGVGNSNNGGAGGGGGAGGAGTGPSTTAASQGGPGRANSLQTGVNITYGNGGNIKEDTSGITANRGHGGGGNITSGGPYNPGFVGSSGVVVIRYTTGTMSVYNNMTLESNTTTTATAPTKGDLVFTYSNGAGTAVVGTNITAEYSADAGSTWTDFGIAAGDVQGTTGGHTIVTKNNVSLTSTSGTNMRYRIKTLVQSVSLATRIHAVSLGWS